MKPKSGCGTSFDPKKQNMKRNILVFGLIAGAIVSAFMGTSMAISGCSAGNQTSMLTSMVVGFAGMAAAFSFIFVGVKNYRDKQNNGIITFGKAFLMGLMISLIASTMYVATWAVEFHFFMPNFIDSYTDMQINQITASGKPDTEIQAAIAEARQVNDNYKNNLLFFAMYTYAEILPVGLIITIISALILRRKTPKLAA
jgi:hypothetical protein